MRCALIIVGLLGCAAPAAPREPMQGPTEAPHGTAGCGATVRCYKQCQLATPCIAACDARATLEAQQQGHAVMRCAIASGCEGEPCVDDRCAGPLEACHGAPVGALPDGVRIDLAYRAPATWQDVAITGALKLAAPDGRATLYVLPSRPWHGSPDEAYRAAWRDALTGLGATTTLTPAPHRRRLANGYALLADGESMATSSGDAVVVVYALVARERASGRGMIVPVVGMYQGPDDALERTLVAWFEGTTIRGGQPTSETLFDTAELVGAWTLADARTRDTLQLAGDGTYTATVLGVAGGRAAARTTRGNWLIEDARLVLQDASGARTRHRIWAVAPLRIAPDEQDVPIANPRMGRGGWYTQDLGIPAGSPAGSPAGGI